MGHKRGLNSSRLRRWGRDGGSLFALVVVMLAARASLADHYRVPTGSMQPTVQPGDQLLVNKLAYGVRVPLSTTYVAVFDGPQAGDVVVLESPEDGEVLLKRVVAVPGDAVAVRRGRLSIDGEMAPIRLDGGKLLEEIGGTWHALSLVHGGGPDFGPVRTPAGHFLVMGDNRGNSLDGRTFGFVRREAILGRAEAIYYRHGFVWREL